MATEWLPQRAAVGVWETDIATARHSPPGSQGGGRGGRRGGEGGGEGREGGRKGGREEREVWEERYYTSLTQLPAADAKPTSKNLVSVRMALK